MAVDVLGIGCCAVDDVLYVDRYPSADSKMEVRQRERRCGGLTSIALMTAARLGASCQFAGALGNDDLSRYALAAMNEYGVDTSTVVVRPDARPVYSVIVVDRSTQSRTILYDPNNVYGADVVLPSAELIREARVLYIDHYGVPGMIRAARIAREAGIPVVADLEDDHSPGFDELLGLVDHLILSQDFALRITRQATPAGAAQKLWRNDRSAVIVTAGAEGCWYVDGPVPPTHCPAFKLTVRDTTGCGDVFHGAYAAALAQHLALPERVCLASAAAALKAANVGGPAGIPPGDEVRRFLAARPTEVRSDARASGATATAASAKRLSRRRPAIQTRKA